MLVTIIPSFKGEKKYAPSPQYLLLSKPTEPLAIHLPLTKDCVKIKQWADEQGFKTAAILGKNTKAYTISMSDEEVRQQIEENGIIPEWVDVLIFDYSLDINVAINNGHIKKLYSEGLATIYNIFKYPIELYHHRNWEEWQEENFPAHMKIPVTDKKLWHKAMGFPTWKDWKEELERLGYTTTTKRGVVYVGKAAEKEEEKNNHHSSPLYLHLGKGKFVEERGVEGIQENVWYTASVLKQVFGFATASGAKMYAEERLGCGVVEVTRSVRGKRARLFAFSTNSRRVSKVYDSQVVHINGEEHLRQVEDIHKFENRKFNEERFLQYLINIATIE